VSAEPAECHDSADRSGSTAERTARLARQALTALRWNLEQAPVIAARSRKAQVVQAVESARMAKHLSAELRSGPKPPDWKYDYS
jgi:hypothetical protein